METLISNIQIEQLATAGGFIAYLLWQNWRMVQRIEQLAKEKDDINEKYVESLIDANKENLEAIRTFDRLASRLTGV